MPKVGGKIGSREDIKRELRAFSSRHNFVLNPRVKKSSNRVENGLMKEMPIFRFSSALIFPLVFFHFIIFYDSVSADEKLTLEECFQRAVEQSETLKVRAAEAELAQAEYREAVAAVYPSIHLMSSERLRSSDDFGTRGGGSNEDEVVNGGGSSGRKKYQFETSVVVQQPIFTGFRELLISRAMQLEAKARDLEIEREREMLFLDVGDLFFQILLFEADLKILKTVEELIEERIIELKKFIELGKSRESEILAAQSDQAEVRALQEQTKKLLAASRELLSFLTGVPSSKLELVDNTKTETVADLEQYLQRAKDRLDLQAAKERFTATEKQLVAAEREKWPALYFEGAAFPYEDPDINRDWEAIVRFDLPLFEGGAIDARIEQSRSRKRIAQITVEEKKRIVEREVRVSFSDYHASRAQVQALAALLDAAQKNYQSQKNDYALGVVTNIEVLQSIRSIQEARRRFIAAESSTRVSHIRLEVAAGGAV